MVHIVILSQGCEDVKGNPLAPGVHSALGPRGIVGLGLGQDIIRVIYVHPDGARVRQVPDSVRFALPSYLRVTLELP